MSDKRWPGHDVTTQLAAQHTVSFHRAAPLGDTAAVRWGPPAAAETASQAAAETASQAAAETASQAAAESAGVTAAVAAGGNTAETTAALPAQGGRAQHAVLKQKFVISNRGMPSMAIEFRSNIKKEKIRKEYKQAQGCEREHKAAQQLWLCGVARPRSGSIPYIDLYTGNSRIRIRKSVLVLYFPFNKP